MTLYQISEGLTRIVRDEEGGDAISLGIHTGVRNTPAAFSRLMTLPGGQGHIVRDEQIIPWRAQGVMVNDNELLLYGPYLEGVTLAEMIETDSQALMPRLGRLCRSCETLGRRMEITPVMHTLGFIFLNDGGVLCLPASLMETIANFQSDSQRQVCYEIFNHPDLEIESRLSYAMAALSFQALTDRSPFASSETLHDLHASMRAGIADRVRLHAPDVHPEVAQPIDDALMNPHRSLPSVAEWCGIFQGWLRGGIHREIDNNEREAIVTAADRDLTRRRRLARQRSFLATNWRRIAIAAVLIVVTASIPITIIRGLLRPRAIAGLPPHEVVRTFYLSTNLLDHATMRDSVDNNAGKRDIEEVMNLFVISRMRLAVELQSPLVDPQTWRNRGEPDIGDGSLYGVERLKISIIRQNEIESEMVAEYLKWRPASEDEIESVIGPGRSIAFDRRDRLLLRREGDSWIIQEIERLRDRVY